MGTMDIDINDVLDISKWEVLQSALADTFGMTFIVLDYKGNPVSTHSHCSEFCKIIRKNAVARRHCFKCAALAGLEAVRHKGPFIYRCNCGIMNAAVPIMVAERYLGTLLFGQVRPDASEKSLSREALISEIHSFYPANTSLDIDSLLEKYDRMPEMDYDRMMQIGKLVNSLVSYIIDRAVNSRNEAQSYELMLRYAVPPMSDDRSEHPAPQQAVELPKADVGARLPVSPDSSIFPALNYIETHRRKMIGMHEMARLCHLSPSYFSKLFLREVGENFTDYVNRRKIEWAREMLHDSSKSITAIAAELGYMDTSYFIKVFKKFEGTTPLVYRQHKL